MYKISGKVINFTKAMENWKVELTEGGHTLTEEKHPKKLLPERLILAIAIFL